ncbi:TPA: response regulator transcription factor [Clostridioides difficile]
MTVGQRVNKVSKLLIVEDDALLSDMMKRLPIQNNYEIEAAYSGSEVLLLLEKQSFDLVLLDFILPSLSGGNILELIRERADIPIIGVSAKTDIDSKVNLIKNGAYDYITKPFDNKELLVRIEAQIVVLSQAFYTFKDLDLNVTTMEVKIKDILLTLTRYEYLILQLLLSAPNKVFTKNNIFESVWSEDFYGDDNAINVHISN